MVANIKIHCVIHTQRLKTVEDIFKTFKLQICNTGVLSCGFDKNDGKF